MNEQKKTKETQQENEKDWLDLLCDKIKSLEDRIEALEKDRTTRPVYFIDDTN